jgi:hypothetical protein
MDGNDARPPRTRLVILCVMLASSIALAGVIGGSGGGGGGSATLDPNRADVASTYRATGVLPDGGASTGPLYTCDGTLYPCFDFGAGGGASNCNAIGTNAGGDLVVGNANSGCIARFGQVHGSQLGTNNTALVGSQIIRLPSTSALDVTAPQGLTINATTAIKGVVRASVSVDFASVPNSTCLAQSVTVTGAAVGDAVSVNADFSMPAPVGIGNARVTATNTVDLRLCNHDPVAAQDPPAGNFIFRLER